jgi:hypothetical protein
MTISDLRQELREAEQRLWFIQQIVEPEELDDAVKARLDIRENLFVQVFFSETTGRTSFALVLGTQRIFGRDCEQGQWHEHPYAGPPVHQPVPEGMSPRPLLQFLVDVERILIDNDLI